MMALMKQIQPTKDDTLVFLGDYVDGGPETKKVIDQLMKWEEEYPHWVFLYGNHEDLMLDALVYNSRIYGSYSLWWGQGGKATAMSYMPEDLTDYEKAISNPADHIPVEHLSWIQGRPRYHETDEHFFVHAGVWPEMSLEENKKTEYRQEIIWVRDDFIFSKYDWGKTIVFGHTVFPYRGKGKYCEPLVEDNKIGIDGMHHNDGVLIALNCNDKTFWFQDPIHD
jgi:serine/threonine protein phosphatase 1